MANVTLVKEIGIRKNAQKQVNVQKDAKNLFLIINLLDLYKIRELKFKFGALSAAMQRN